jgi:predicted DNA-binding transcriptional regulator AlpA
MSRPQSGDSPTPMLLTVRLAAAALSVSERTLWAISAPRGPIPVVRIGRSVRYDPGDLREWLEAQKIGGPRP